MMMKKVQMKKWEKMSRKKETALKKKMKVKITAAFLFISKVTD